MALKQPKRRVLVGDKTYKFTRRSGDTRTVTKANGTRTAVLKDKQTGGQVTITKTKSSDAKNARIGAYARAHKTVNADGSITYAKKGGGTVTRTLSVSGSPTEAKKKRKPRKSSSSSSTPGGNGPGGNDPGTP